MSDETPKSDRDEERFFEGKRVEGLLKYSSGVTGAWPKITVAKGDPLDTSPRQGDTCPVCGDDRTACCDLLPEALVAGKTLMEVLDEAYLSEPIRVALDAFQAVIDKAKAESDQKHVGGWDLGKAPDYTAHVIHDLSVVADEDPHGRIR